MVSAFDFQPEDWWSMVGGRWSVVGGRVLHSCSTYRRDMICQTASPSVSLINGY